MPIPLSTIFISDLPPFLTKILILFAPASILFSTSSFITEAGLSITSPAAILLTTSSDNNRILFIY